MRQTRLYYPERLKENTTVVLPKELSHRLKNVLRVRVGETIFLFNGQGSEWQAVITAVDKLISVQIQQAVVSIAESPMQIHLAQVVSRGERMDYTIQKAVELGVTSITPLTSEYCQVKLTEDRWQKRKEHWQAIIVSACEQSGRATLPQLNDVLPLSKWLEQCVEQQKLILHPHLSEESSIDWVKQHPSLHSIAIVVGAEGGLSEQEVKFGLQHDFITWQIGPRILRTETAGLAAIAVLQWQYGDFKSATT